MRIPLSWVEEYVKVNLPVDDLVERLTFAGIETNSIEHVGANWDAERIFVGQVIGVRQHPNADRLVLITVDFRHGDPWEVVTGAPTLRPGDRGQKVVFATTGARLIDGHSDALKYVTLKPGKIRGVTSAGMACSEKELGISDDHTGIIILPDDAPVGMPLAEYWGDTVLDLEFTPNLAYCSSVVGVAREISAITGAQFMMPAPTGSPAGAPIAGQVQVQIADPDLCARYSAALITGVRIGPSPQWMQRRLTLAGMRPINNIVDITNYVMIEWGQPLHAFDYRRLHGLTGSVEPSIIVRRARDGERMVTLDGAERAFTHDMLLITDGGGPVAVAGTMGGRDSEVTNETRDILLEAACFSNTSIRRTSAALKLPSEAAQRFGRGIDPELTTIALQRAAELMSGLAGGVVAQGFADCYPVPPRAKVVDLRLSEIKRLLGIELPASEVQTKLQALGYEVESIPDDVPALRTRVPSYRLDVSQAADLVEDIACLYGYDRMPSTLINEEQPMPRRNVSLELAEHMRDILVCCGLTEIINYSLTNLESIAKLTPGGTTPDPKTYLRVTNPLTREREFLRQMLMNTTLETVASNWRFVERVSVFEVAHVYLPEAGQDLPAEPRHLSIAVTGPREARTWLQQGSGVVGFYDIKGIAEALCQRLGIDQVEFAPVQHVTFHPGRAASLIVSGQKVGVLGEVHPLVKRSFDLPEQPVCLMEVDLEKLLAEANPCAKYRPISRMPVLNEDLALVVNDDVSIDALLRTIREAGGSWLRSVVLFDIYRGAQIGAGKKSLAFGLTFQAEDVTLTSEQVARQRARIVQRVADEVGAQVRA